MPHDEDGREGPTFSAIFPPLATHRRHLPNGDLLALCLNLPSYR